MRIPKKVSVIIHGVARGLIAVSLSTLLTIVLDPVLKRNVLFIQLAAVAITALTADLWIAAFTATLAAMSHNFFAQLPRYSFSVQEFTDQLELLIFWVVALTVSYFVHRLKAATETAKRAIQAREEVLGIVSHDLKNPLTVIEMQAALLARSRVGGTEGAPRAIEQIRDSVWQMNLMINDLLDMDRIRSGRLSIHVRPTLASSLLAAASRMMAPLAARREIQLEINLEGADFQIQCDPDRVLQIFSNLLGNAFKFSAPKSRVIVDAAMRGTEAVFAFRDEGIGIVPEHLPHVFDRYWQAQDTSHLGTGLGLAIVQGIVHAHEGRITVESELGKGSIFTVTLPRASALPASSAIA